MKDKYWTYSTWGVVYKFVFQQQQNWRNNKLFKPAVSIEVENLKFIECKGLKRMNRKQHLFETVLTIWKCM